MQFERGETTSGGLSSWWEPVMKAWGSVNASFCEQEASCGAISVEMGFCKTLHTLHSSKCTDRVPQESRQMSVRENLSHSMKGYHNPSGFTVEGSSV